MTKKVASLQGVSSLREGRRAPESRTCFDNSVVRPVYHEHHNEGVLVKRLSWRSSRISAFSPKSAQRTTSSGHSVLRRTGGSSGCTPRSATTNSTLRDCLRLRSTPSETSRCSRSSRFILASNFTEGVILADWLQTYDCENSKTPSNKHCAPQSKQ